MSQSPTENLRGAQRERSLSRERYVSSSYFELKQLCSFAHQIHDIYQFQPKSLIEIGIGNGFTSTFFRNNGYDVFTVDINPNLSPDLCAPISELPSQLAGRQFDLVVCCEVLEHLPLSEFEESLKILRGLAPQLYLTLPQARRFYGLGGFFQLPRFGCFNLDLHLSKSSALPSEHFWEVGSSRETKKSEIVQRLKHYYPSVQTQRYSLNPYHLAFFGRP